MAFENAVPQQNVASGTVEVLEPVGTFELEPL